MTDGDALLRAVIDDPENDTPRLVYADWLDENGRPELAQVYRGDCWRPGGKPDGRRHFIEKHPDLCDRLVYMPGATPGVVRLVERGVVFVMAWWSGPSRQAFAGLAHAVREQDPTRELLIVVVDADGIGEDFGERLTERFGVGLSGAGEGIWVRGGRPVKVTWSGSQPADLLTGIRMALREA